MPEEMNIISWVMGVIWLLFKFNLKLEKKENKENVAACDDRSPLYIGIYLYQAVCIM